jgi:hypothetical protein
VQRLSPGLAAGKQTSRILSRNRSEPYSRQTARVPAIKSARISLRCVRSRLALNGRSETSAVCPLSRQSGLGLRHRDAPPSVTKPTENARSAEPVLSRRPERVHAREMKPPGYPRLPASARREPIEPAQWPPSPTIRRDAGFSLERAARSRSDNLVISTTEQHAALPYQGSGHWRPASRLRRFGQGRHAQIRNRGGGRSPPQAA